MAKIRPQQIRRRNNMLSELAEMLAECLQRFGATPEAAANEAAELAFRLHQRWKGITFTFPVNDELAMARLELHIMTEYDGSNADHLTRKYGVTEGWIYGVVRKHQKRRTDKNQHTLDLGDGLN
ncbi:Mor transcription activator family protein [Pseudomonas paralcaligenes]|uniref:Mor transcription activator family protein n=1 Tax=Pseudomonas paralcaligenes TaxID=2772558 RepID=UPI001C80B5D6|nr:Mor transcription activator family protein [Pseudomonas paralcaligenes]